MTLEQQIERLTRAGIEAQNKVAGDNLRREQGAFIGNP
jgi:hypothetical protein